ncbi:MAG: hypothetical protein ACTSW1_05355 [Candidatus Hodarchaeales archaeon]
MKKSQSIISLTFFSLLLISNIAFLKLGNFYSLANDTSNSVETHGLIPPLQNNNHNSDPIFSDAGTKNIENNKEIPPVLSIVGNPPYKFFPGDEIHIETRFTIPNSNYAIVDHNVSIFLFKEGDSNPLNPEYFLKNTTTNGTVASGVPISLDPQEGWINTTITVPSIDDLQTKHGVLPGDNVSIYQYIDPTKTKGVESVSPYAYIDNFTLAALPSISVNGGFTNDASDDNEFRQGENASLILTARSGSDPVENVIISCELFNTSNDAVIANDSGTTGFTYYLRDVTTGNPSNKTDANGELKLIIDTLYPTAPEGNYYINITGDYALTSYYFPSVPETRYANSSATFILNNEMDTATITIESAVPSDYISPPNENYTVVTARVSISYVYTGTTYYLANIPVRAILDSYPAGVNLSIANGFPDNGSGWTLTNSSGYVKFNITSNYPIPYQLKTPTITVEADLRSNSAPASPYPSGPPSQPHRFIRGPSDQLVITDSQLISIDPEFIIAQIGLNWMNTTTIRPGEAAVIEFEVNSTQSPSIIFSDVPVKISINQSIAGVSLDFSGYSAYGNGYYLTDLDGRIRVTVSSTYLLTPEIIQNVLLDLVVDLENDSNVRWMGTKHAGTATFSEYNKSWTDSQFSGLSIDPQFIISTIVLSTTNETGDTTIRSGDGITLTFKVQDDSNNPLPNVPVNVSLLSNYPGVTFTVTGHGGFAYSGYYYTNSSGVINVNLKTTYGNTPKNLVIQLNATADFEHDSLDVWYIGQNPSSGDFRSNSSYSYIIQGITVDPQYFTGDIYIPGDNPPAYLVQQNETLSIEYRLKVNYGGTDVFPSIDDINISILINGSLPSVFNMNVSPSSSQNSSASSVTFDILTNATGVTPEAIYIITAKADFSGDTNLIYNITHATVPTGHLEGYWVNGSDSDNFSRLNYTFQVKNIDRISLEVSSIVDPSHTDEGYNVTSGYFEVYRNTSIITINGTYMDSTQEPVQDRDIIIAYDYPGLSSPQTLATVTTNTLGKFSEPIILPSTTPLRDIIIFGRDPTDPVPQEIRQNITNIRVVSTVSLDDFSISGFTGNAVHVGEKITASGNLLDDQGVPITSSELNNRIRIIGWTGSQEVGTPSVISPSSGAYSTEYTIPSSYTLGIIFIRLNITSNSNLVHFRPTYKDLMINVYSSFEFSNLILYFTSNGHNTSVTNGTSYIIKDILNKTISFQGQLVDQLGRPLGSKDIISYWNSTQSQTTLPSDALFNQNYDFPGYTNVTMIWQLYHITDNGTTLPIKYIITLSWEVYDETAPNITVISPTNLNDSTISNNPTTTFTLTVIDPSTNIVSVGLDNASVTITIDGTSYVMTNTAGSTFTYDWDTSSATDKVYTISFYARDLANQVTNITYYVVIDVIAPNAIINVVTNSAGYVNITSGGNITITGTVTDSQSNTGRNSGIDEASVYLRIINASGYTIVNRLIQLTSGSYNEDWTIILNYNDIATLTRDPRFLSTSENWIIRIVYSDLAGNSATSELSVKLDKDNPNIAIITDVPNVASSEFSIDLIITDTQTGVNYSSLHIELYNSDTDQLIELIYKNLNYTRSDTNVQIFYNPTDLNSGNYFIRVKVFDLTGNLASIDSSIFNIRPKTTTTSPPTNSTTTTQNPVKLGTVDFVAFIIFDILALAGGIGIAFVYEKYKQSKLM